MPNLLVIQHLETLYLGGNHVRVIAKGGDCKVELIQSFCWIYFVPNLLVIQHLETLYLGGNHVRVVCEKV